MHAFSRWMALATLLSGLAAHADKNDLRIVDLGAPESRWQETYDPTAHSKFKAFARTIAASLTSVNLMPPETLGHAAFNISAELSVVSLPSRESVFIPMEGGQPSTVLVPSFHVRKGLPFSVELGGRVGWVERSRMMAATGELKWAVNEGFTYLPDIGVRGHVTKLMGVQNLSLTSVGLDAGIGKQFPLGGMVTLTPYGGLDFNFVRAISPRMFFAPNACLTPEQGQERDGPTPTPENWRRPLCPSEGDPRTLVENAYYYKRLKFQDNMTQRIYGGARFIGGVLQLGAEISFTRLGSAPVADDSKETRGLPTVVTFNTSLGLDF